MLVKVFALICMMWLFLPFWVERVIYLHDVVSLLVYGMDTLLHCLVSGGFLLRLLVPPGEFDIVLWTGLDQTL